MESKKEKKAIEKNPIIYVEYKEITVVIYNDPKAVAIAFAAIVLLGFLVW